MKSAIVESGVVINVIIGQIEGSIICGDDVAIGWTYDGADFHAPPPPPMPEPKAPELSRAQFVVALTKTTPPILTDAEALEALERWPAKFANALADKPLEYRAAAVESWRTITTVSRDAPLFLDLLAYYAAQAQLTEAQAESLGDAIFAGGGNG